MSTEELFDILPAHRLRELLLELSLPDLEALCSTNKRARKFCDDALLWRKKCSIELAKPVWVATKVQVESRDEVIGVYRTKKESQNAVILQFDEDVFILYGEAILIPTLMD